MKTPHRSGLLIFLLTSGCGIFPIDAGVDYLPLATLFDAKSGYYVELAQIDTISSHGYAVYVFKDAGPRKKFNPTWKPVINTAGIESEPPKFHLKNGCYVLEVQYGYGALIESLWKDQDTGATVCFDLLPDRGPKGGFTP